MEDIYTLPDVQIQKKIGDKIKASRLKQNFDYAGSISSSIVPQKRHRLGCKQVRAKKSLLALPNRECKVDFILKSNYCK